MNTHLTNLLKQVNARRAQAPDGAGKLSRSDLIDALRLLSAPHSLEGAALYCRRFTDMLEANPAIKPAKLGDINDRLTILREVAAAGEDDPHFAQSHYPIDSPTPLQPYTGDGPLCDVLMLKAARDEDQPDFQRITEWFVGLCLRYHHQTLTRAVYANYLDGEASSGNRLNRHEAGGPIAAAGCQIRKLADPDQRASREALLELGLGLTEGEGSHLAWLAQLVHRAPTIHASEVRSLVSRTGLDEDGARHQLALMRRHVHGAIRHVLRLTWRLAEEGVGASRRRLHQAQRDYSRPRVRRYGAFSETVHVIDPNAGDSPIAIDVYGLPAPTIDLPRPPRGGLIDVGVDPRGPEGDPLYQIYIGGSKDDLLASYYAAKGWRYAQEYEHALLPWSRTRLGRDALQALTGALPRTGGDATSRRAAKLIVLISLMTGRTLEEASRVRIQNDANRTVPKDVGLFIALAEGTLSVRAATPELVRARRRRRRVGADGQGAAVPDRAPAVDPQFILHARGEFLAVALPAMAIELLTAPGWLATRSLDNRMYVSEAKRWLGSLPAHLGINPRAVRDALVYPVLALTRGDLGLVKLITDRQALNFANIIHYAAYPAEDASALWARALTQVLGTPVEPVRRRIQDAVVRPAYVGTPDAIDVGALRGEFDRLRTRLRGHLSQADAAGQVEAAIRAHNLLTLYTLLWLNLATAGRARVSPAPVALIEGVAVVADKHRADGSAERLLPLTDGVMAQLRAYFDYVWHLAFRIPAFKPIADAFTAGILQFQFLNSQGEVIGFRPKWLYEAEQLIPMPGNWARKLVRQQMALQGGRFLDAGMGHWVAGRHPYRVTSNFAFRRFREVWLVGQAQLERALGFEVIAHPQVEGSGVDWPMVAALQRGRPAPSAPGAKRPATGAPRLDLDAEYRRADEALYEAILASETKDPKAVAALVGAVARQHAGDDAAVVAVVRACCEYARDRWKVPIFADRPRFQFQRDWLVDEVALYNLGYFTRQVLPVFRAELAHLPAAADPACADARDLGRFVMLCIWRQGLVAWPVLDAFLQGYGSVGILATGALRYVPSRIRCRRNGALMDRLHYLEPYCQVYFVSEYARLKAALASLLALNPQQRRARIQSALGRYLQTLAGVKAGNLLTITCAAAQQHHLLHGSPVLVAYAAAEFETHDLSDDEIRHLAGYDARTTHRALPELAARLERTSREHVPLPSSDLEGHRDLVHQIAYRKSPEVEKMLRDLGAIKVHAPLPRLLKAFARWYLQHQAKAVGDRLTPPEKRLFEHVVEVVGYALLGLSVADDANPTLDEAVLVNLEEQFQDLHPRVETSLPFGLFRKFLRLASTGAAAREAGVALGTIEPPAPRGVLAKVVTPASIRAVARAIDRVDESGIGNPDVRAVAQRHLEAIATFGLRRTEAEHIREMDVQGDLIRVQPYGTHTLKTAWSDRILPKALVAFADLGWVQSVHAGSERQLLAHGLSRTVQGDNFFDAVNKLVQRKASDPAVHLHTVRHTLASRLLLSAVSDAVDYQRIEAQFPWMTEFLVPDAQMDVLFGGEGQSGHGLQAIAALLGHSHPLTTLRHYIHTVGIAFYAHLLGQAVPDLMRAFERRLGSPRTMQRRIQAWREATTDMDAVTAEAFLQQHLRAEAETLCPEGVHFDEQMRVDAPAGPVDEQRNPEPPAYDRQAISYERFAKLEAVLRGEAPDDTGLDLDLIEQALARIYEIPTGKRGAKEKRHPCDRANGRRLPHRLAAKSPTQLAAALCRWIEHLRTRDPDLLGWLLDRWLFASEKEFGRIRLDDHDRARWQQLPTSPDVTLVTEEKTFKRKSEARRSGRTQRFGRICCKDVAGNFIRRDVLAVRWAMTWTSALLARLR